MKQCTFYLFFLAFLFAFIPARTEVIDTVVVSAAGNGMFTTIQAALNSVSCKTSDEIVILVKKGIYHEKVCIFPVHSRIVMKGEDCGNTIIQYDDFSGKVVNGDSLTTHTSYTLRIMSDNVRIENISVENSAGQVGQAVAVEIKGDRIHFRHCRFLGNQDTFYANGDSRIYCEDCYIEGTVDFIFGRAVVYFEQCHIHSKKNAYITAASTPENCRYGFVFKDCTLSADEGIQKVYLGRPWRSFAKTVFLNCAMGGHILPEGWNNWSNPEKEKTAYYAEYQSSGAGASDLSARVPWSHQLTAIEAAVYSKQNVFGKKSWNINFPDNWNPR